MTKPRRVSARRPELPLRKSSGGMLMGLFMGLVIGILIAFGFIFYLNKAPLPFNKKHESGSRETPRPTPGNTTGGTATPQAAPTPLALPGKPGDKVMEKPRFDFYDILPGKKAAEAAVSPAPTSAAEGAKPVAKRETYYLQAGAFQKASDADNLKARLAMMGIEANVAVVEVPEKGTLHRVRVGPLASADEMNTIRARIAQDGLQAAVIKQ